MCVLTHIKGKPNAEISRQHEMGSRSKNNGEKYLENLMYSEMNGNFELLEQGTDIKLHSFRYKKRLMRNNVLSFSKLKKLTYLDIYYYFFRYYLF